MNNRNANVEEQIQFCDAITLDKFNAIQPHGVLLILNPENMHIVQCSRNSSTILSVAPEQLLNASIKCYLPDNTTWDFLLKANKKWKKMYWISGNEKKCVFGYVQQFSSHIMLEIELHAETDTAEDIFEVEQQILIDTQASLPNRSFSEFSASICNTIMSITDSDRVVIYHFENDNTGVVIAESAKAGMDSYMDLRFPATDIPQPVREMYLNNHLRYIPDAKSQPIEIIPPINPLTKQPINISDSQLRMVAPVHVEYMKNMEIDASLSIGIIYDNMLWGLIACHNVQAKYMPVNLRFLLLLIANTTASQLIAIENVQALSIRNRSQLLANSFAEIISESQILTEVINRHSSEILELVNAQSMTLIIGNEIYNYGDTPNREQIKALVEFIQKNHPSKTYVTNSLLKEFPQASKYKNKASGLISITISATAGFFVLFYRPEKCQEIKWAGDPSLVLTVSDVSYSPRSSFKRCIQLMNDNSTPWAQQDVKSAEFISSIIKNKILNDYLKQEILQDFLTGLLNRNSLNKVLHEEMARAHRDAFPISILMLDIDFFKKINDTYGHTSGDTVLVTLANFLKANCRPYDKIFRYGGEEFLIMMPNLDRIGAQNKAEQLQQKMKNITLSFDNENVPFPTASIGISEYPFHGDNIQTLIDLADDALYQAKNNGRDRVVVCQTA